MSDRAPANVSRNQPLTNSHLLVEQAVSFEIASHEVEAHLGQRPQVPFRSGIVGIPFDVGAGKPSNESAAHTVRSVTP